MYGQVIVAGENPGYLAYNADGDWLSQSRVVIASGDVNLLRPEAIGDEIALYIKRR